MKNSSVCITCVIVASLVLIVCIKVSEQAARNRHETVSHRLPDWSPDDNHHIAALKHRMRRGVPLSTLRRLMTNIALSEYYRLRGIEVLSKLNAKVTRKPEVTPTVTTSETLLPAASHVVTVTSTPPSLTLTDKLSLQTQADVHEKVFEKFQQAFENLEKKNRDNMNSRYLQLHEIV